MAAFLRNSVELLVTVLFFLVLGRALISWVDPTYRTEAGRWLLRMTEPILAPVRRLLPGTGGLDFSAFVVLLVLGAILRIVSF